MHPNFIENLQNRLTQPLPGLEAQYRMAPSKRRKTFEVPDDVKLAAVLALLYPGGEEWNLVLIERASLYPGDRHSGQIGFPGGRHEDSDPDMAFTALRETEEEVGAPADEVSLLGALTPLFIPVSNFMVHPFVGYMSARPDLVPEPAEVASILEVPLSHLLDPSTVQDIDIPVPEGIVLKGVPYFNAADKIVWGATAMMLNELIEVLRENP